MYQNDKGGKDVALEIHLLSGSITKGREQIGMLQQICVQIYISPLELLFQMERENSILGIFSSKVKLAQPLLEYCLMLILWPQVESDTDSDNDVVLKQKKVFVCPKEGCMSSFTTSSNLDAHLIVSCKNDHAALRSMPDMCKLKYCSKLISGAFSSANSQLISTEVEVDDYTPPLKEMGWALKVHKPKTRFTEDQKEFLLDKFNAGKVTGRKEDPLKVAEEMRTEQRNGQNRFRKSEFLTSQQISSFCSRITIKEKKMDRRCIGSDGRGKIISVQKMKS